MSVFAYILQDFNLPNATTWFYFSLLLAIALFFKFARLLSVRNLDVLLLFGLVPGFLLLQESQARQVVDGKIEALTLARFWGESAHALGAASPGISGVVDLAGAAVPVPPAAPPVAWYGYLWLLAGSAVLFVRCLAD